MRERERKYLNGRFKDYYRRNDIELPPEHGKREWGYVPWSETRMIRHLSYFDMGNNLKNYLSGKGPHSVFFSCAKYEDPGRGTMDEKGWIGADLIFDIDAPEIPSVKKSDSKLEQLNKAKEETIKLLDFLKNDMGFTDYQIVFSGGKGFHVHIRNSEVQKLESPERDELTYYLNPDNLSVKELLRKESNDSLRVNPACYGWIDRFYKDYVNRIRWLREKNEKELEQYLSSFEEDYDVDEVLSNLKMDKTILGEIEEESFIYKEADRVLQKTLQDRRVSIDQPVTRDTRRLIRLPGSLHGGSGLKTTKIDEEDLEDFRPLTDPIPESFMGSSDLKLEIIENSEYQLNGKNESLEEGDIIEVPEYIGVHLMCREVAVLD